MDKSAETKKLLREILGFNPNFPISGIVQQVTGQTCSVKIAGGLIVTDVKINATVTDEDDFFLLEPATGSDVLMLSGDGTLRSLYLIKVDKVGRFVFSQGGLNVEFDSSDKKVKIENATVSLKGLFSSVATIIKTLKVNVIGTGAPSGTITADIITAVDQFETDFNSLLK